MKNSWMVLGLFLATHSAMAANSLDLYCFQTSPSTSDGFIIDSAEISTDSSKPWVIVKNLGTGLLTSDGDGTVGESFFSSEDRLVPSSKYQSKSAEWRNSVPFLLPLSQDSSTYVLYIQPQGFNGDASQEFAARLKVTRSGKEKNFLMSCNHP